MKSEMNSKDATKNLKGKMIARVDMRRAHNTGSGLAGYTANPKIYFTDGSSISFYTIEQEDGYGTDILFFDPVPEAAK